MGFWSRLLGISSVILGVYLTTLGAGWFFIGLILIAVGIGAALVNTN